MSLMNFREPNQVKWVGVRPAHNGEQIIRSGSITGGTYLLYTVPSGKVFYLTYWDAVAHGSNVGYGVILVRDTSDVNQYNIANFQTSNSTTELVKCCSLFYPIEIPGGWDICLYSDNASYRIRATIRGWIE